MHEELGGIETPEPIEVARFPMVNVPVCVFTSVAKCVLQCTHSGSARACVRATPCAKETPCVVKGMSETPCVSGVVASVPRCVLPSTPCMSETLCMDEAPRVSGAACARETARVCEQPCVSERTCMKETPRVSAPACVNSMACARETARVSERPSVRGTACVRSLYEREMTVGMSEHAAASPGVNVMVRCLSLVIRMCAWLEWKRRRRQRDKGRVAAVVALGTVPGWHSSERAVRAVPGTRPPHARLRE